MLVVVGSPLFQVKEFKLWTGYWWHCHVERGMEQRGTCTLHRSSHYWNRYHASSHRGTAGRADRRRPPVFLRTPPENKKTVRMEEVLIILSNTHTQVNILRQVLVWLRVWSKWSSIGGRNAAADIQSPLLSHRSYVMWWDTSTLWNPPVDKVIHTYSIYEWSSSKHCVNNNIKL